MSKYYTPNISEFVIGFEFESCYWYFSENREWTKARITEENIEDFLDLYKNDAYSTEFRKEIL